MGEPSYEAILAYPDGSSTVARYASVASHLGLSGLVVRNARSLPDDPPLGAIRSRHAIDIARGVELGPADPDDVSGRLPHLHERFPVLMVAGGSRRINRFVADQRHVDVLTRPIRSDTPYVDAGTVKVARENDVAFEVNLSPLTQVGGHRVRYLQRLKQLWRLIDHYDSPYVVSMRPTSHLDLVGPRALAALGDTIGLGAQAIERGLAHWGTIADRRREESETLIRGETQGDGDEADDR